VFFILTVAAAEVAVELVPDGVGTIYLGHLSRDCNRPELAKATVEKRLREIGATHVRLESTSQEKACATLDLG